MKIVDFERIQILIESEGDFCKLDLNLSAREAIKKVIKDMTCGQGLLCAFELFCSVIAQNFNDTIKGSHYQCSEQHKGARGHDVNDMLLHYCRFAEVESSFACSKRSLFYFQFWEKRDKSPTNKKNRISNVFMDTQVNEDTIGEFSL